MDKKEILDVLKQVREKGPKRKFSQSFDLLIKLKNIDIKKNEQKVDAYIVLPHLRGKKAKICGLVQQLEGKSKEAFDFTIKKDNFDQWKDKKKIKKLAREYDFFVAQAEIMTTVASVFGKALGPSGKMPNPKAGCVVPAAIPDLKPIAERLSKTVRIVTKNEAAIKVPVGNENMKDDEIAENIEAVYNAVLNNLHQRENNLDKVSVKLTMGPLTTIGDKQTGKVIEKGKKK